MFVVLAAVALLAGVPVPEQDCTLTHLERCRNTNVLVPDPAFGRALRAFIGPGRADYLYHGTLIDQQFDVLGGPPDDPERIGDLYRFTACRHHSCDEKGAVVLEPKGRIVATAILHSTCLEPKKTTDCPFENVLSLFVRDPASARPVADNLVAWAKTEVDVKYHMPGLPIDRLVRIEVYSVAHGKRTRIAIDRLGPR